MDDAFAVSRRGLGLLGGGVLASLATSALPVVAFCAETTIPLADQNADPYAMVDPELRAAARRLANLTVSAETLQLTRTQPPRPPRPAPAPQFEDRTIQGSAGASDVHIALLDGTAGRKGSPAFLYLHGGGFVAGSARSRPTDLQEVAEICKALVVSVEYRLAPETPFPGALEDNYAALTWLNKNAEVIGIDPARIAIGGDSAGGGHAVMLSLAARERGEFQIAFQSLKYPMLDDRTGSTKRAPPDAGRFVWNADSNRYGWQALLGRKPSGAWQPRGAVPARVKDLSHLPPTFIGVGALDLFADEDIDFARRLVDAGVPTELLVVPGAFHGFDLVEPTAKVSERFHAACLNALVHGLSVG